MNKNTIFVSAIAFLLTLFTACDAADSESAWSSGDKAVVRVNIAATNRHARTVTPNNVALQDVTEWQLLGGIQGAPQTELAIFTETQGATIALERATWDFTLNGYKGDVSIMTGTIQGHVIDLTATNVLNFTVDPIHILEGEGTLSITIELPAGSGITTARIFKDETEVESAVTPIEDRIVFTSPYDAGAYYFSVRLYKGDELYGVVSEVVHVWANCASEKTYTLTDEDLKLAYIIIYHLRDGETETDHYQYTDANKTLPTLSSQGYVFRGWCENEDLDGDAVFTIPAGSRGDKDFYPKWQEPVQIPDGNVTLAESLAWISENAEAGGAYAVTLSADETIGPTTLSYSVANVSVTLKGDGARRTVSLSSNGSLFTVESGVTLTLDENVTLQGLSGNTTSLVYVYGGTLVMQDGSKISGNEAYSSSTTPATPASSYGGGVSVIGGTFTMSGGEISGNSSLASYYAPYYSYSSSAAAYGGGVYVGGTFTMSGGKISGNSSSSSESSYSDNSHSYSYGGGVYVSGGTFTMSGGEISGNTASYSHLSLVGGGSHLQASYGGGVYVSWGTLFTKQGGGIIYGADASDSLKNTASGRSSYGHAVYAGTEKIRNATAGVGVTLDSGWSGWY